MAKDENDLFKKLSDSLTRNLLRYEEIELEDVTIDVGELQIRIPPILRRALPKVKPVELAKIEFTPPRTEWIGKVAEVKLGAVAGDGGTRDRSHIIGGETTAPFYTFENSMPHPPVISMDVFDVKIHLPRTVRAHFEDVLEDPPEWAKKCVEKYSAEMVNLHLVSTDPYIKDTSPRDAAKVVEDVLQAVKVPLCVGGSGNPTKDIEVFEKVAEVGRGERLLINSLNLDMDLEKATKPVKEHGHAVIAFTQMDLDKARELNRRLYDYLPKDQIVMDVNCAGIGYGLEYGFTAAERARLAALKGDPELQQPLASGASNAWAAREAWLGMEPRWGPKEIRGPIWETVTALSMLLAGADYLMMLHPTSMKAVKDIVGYLLKSGGAKEASDWTSARLGD
jgi:acetyl-CoA decarbonylase/synthase complex subunit delta